jgi:hypothetical protein
MLDQVDFAKIAALNFTVPVVTSDPSPTAADEGRIIYNTTSNALKYCNETPAWITLGAAGAGVSDTRAILSGNGLTGGGDLSQDRTLHVVSANADLSVGTDDITVVAAPKWSTARTLTLTGDIGGSVSFDGSGAINMTNTAIGSLVIVDGDVSNSANIATSKINGLDTALASHLPKVSPTLTSGDLTLVQSPTQNLHAATKAYVDLATQGLNFKQGVACVATAQRALTGTTAIDGVTLVSGTTRVLLVAQTSAIENGIWIANSGAWSRATDADNTGEISDGTLVPVQGGTSEADSQYLCTATTANPWVPGTSSSTWTKFASVSTTTAGPGLGYAGGVISLATTNPASEVTIQADNFTVVAAPKWSTARTITLTGAVTSSAVTYDGTANASIATTLDTTGLVKHFTANIGATTSGTPLNILHSLGTRDVTVEVYRNSTPWDSVQCSVGRPDTNNVSVTFATGVAANTYRIVVVGK